MPIRTCISCGAKRCKGNLIRLVLMDMAGTVVRDDSGTRPGRGAYVCPRKTCWENLEQGGRLDRAFRNAGPMRLHIDVKTHEVSDSTIH
jgi:uncharacterized protein